MINNTNLATMTTSAELRDGYEMLREVTRTGRGRSRPYDTYRPDRRKEGTSRPYVTFPFTVSGTGTGNR